MKTAWALVSFVSFVLCVPAAATQYTVDWNDFDGPHWTGTIDTVADTLKINSWVENPGGMDFHIESIIWPREPITVIYGPPTPDGLSYQVVHYDIPEQWNKTMIDWIVSSWGGGGGGYVEGGAGMMRKMACTHPDGYLCEKDAFANSIVIREVGKPVLEQLQVGDAYGLAVAVGSSGPDLYYDFNLDGVVDMGDFDVLHQATGTGVGDVNFDGAFTSDDMILAMNWGNYEWPTTWSDWRRGDWNGDGRFNSGDMVDAFVAGWYENNEATAVVPEPAALVLSLIGVLWVVTMGRRST